mmetsp:Transcript_11370/g.24481  ORF Transcript_11370/g.24481 Transcript_11370/m.24481 type:complete len:665 (+) Transcript_11370:668-2662(+)
MLCNDGCVCADCKNRKEFAGVGGDRTVAIREILGRKTKTGKGRRDLEVMKEKFDEETIKQAVPGCLCVDDCLEDNCYCFSQGIKCGTELCICKGCGNSDKSTNSSSKKSSASSGGNESTATSACNTDDCTDQPAEVAKGATEEASTDCSNNHTAKKTIPCSGRPANEGNECKNSACDHKHHDHIHDHGHDHDHCHNHDHHSGHTHNHDHAQGHDSNHNVDTNGEKESGDHSNGHLPSSESTTPNKSTPPKPKKKKTKSKTSSTSTRSRNRKPTAIPFSIEEFPQLAIDQSIDYTEYATSFKRPLFKEPSRPLEIAYSHRQQMKYMQDQACMNKDAIYAEYLELLEKLRQKKMELTRATDEVKKCAQQTGAWTKKVFDLELREPCTWNSNYQKVKDYVREHGSLPPNYRKTKTEEEKSLSLWLDRIRLLVKEERRKRSEAAEVSNTQEEEDGDDDDENEEKRPRQHEMEQEQQQHQQTKKRKRYERKVKKSVLDYPHRLECLEKLGLVWGDQNENKWEAMFQKLVLYKEEYGTTRFPSDEQCAASGDQELIELQKWVKSQVLNFRYGAKKKNLEVIRRFLDIGFSFEKWYAKPGKVRKMKGEELEKFDELAQNLLEQAERQPKKKKKEIEDEMEEEDDFDYDDYANDDGEEVVEMSNAVEVSCGA